MYDNSLARVASLNFQLIGLNHKTAPVEMRERLAISESHLPDALRHLTDQPGVEEGFIISTCNRVEVLARTTNGSADLRGFLCRYFDLNPGEYNPHLYEYHSENAICHLFRVTSSLDSMVIGESQILGQVKHAYVAARAAGTLHTGLNLLLTRAFAVAKRVRTETAVGSSAISMASIAVELAEKIFESLSGKRVFLVGTGKMSELAARHLVAHGAESVFVSSRNFEKASQMADRFHGQAIPFEQLYQTCDQADIVITSTAAPHAIFRREHGELFLRRRKNRPMIFIDIAVPRDVAAEMNELSGVFVYNIDDLQHMISSNVATRLKEGSVAEAIVQDEVTRFRARLRMIDATPTILSLQSYFETIRKAEMDRVRGRLGTLTREQEMAIEAVSRGIVNKILHLAISALKSASHELEANTIVELLQHLFDLEITDHKT